MAKNLTRRQWLPFFGAALMGGTEWQLRQEWLRIADATDGTVGVAALHLSTGAFVSLNGGQSFPLASVCKVPIAMNMLALIDEGKFARSEQIEVLPQDVWAGVSEMEKRSPRQRRFPLDEMIHLMVSESDNTAVETLYRVGGGKAAMARRFREWKVDGMRIDRSERECALDRNGVTHHPPPSEWNDQLLEHLMDQVDPADRYRATLRYLADSRDTGTPKGTVRLFARLFRGEVLSRASTDFLIESLKQTTTFRRRLKGLLPSGTVVAHKTGSTGAVNGLTAATNDSGVIFLPDQSQLAISVYIKASTHSDSERDRVIAHFARAAFDFSS